MAAGIHLSALCSDTEERNELGLAFRQEGLGRGDGCVCLVDDLGAARVLDPGRRQSTPGVCAYPDVHLASDICLHAGQFSADRMTAFLLESAVRAVEAGFPWLRVIVEMDWLLQQTGTTVDHLVRYEAAMAHVVGRVPAMVLCLYDLHRFGVDMLATVLTTHQTVYVDGSVLVNPHYLAGGGQVAAPDPDEARDSSAGAPRRGTQRTTAGDSWSSLTDSELRIVAHVVAGRTNREVAALLVVSRHTVDAHLKHIFIKLGIHTRVELTVLALRQAAGR